MHHSLTDLKPAAASALQEEIEPKSAGLTSLPRELRDKIYDYLLRSHKFDVLRSDAEAPSKFDLSILCINHMFHREASQRLYEANPWICMAIEPILLGALVAFCNEKKIIRRVFPGDRPVPMTVYTRAAVNALATITLQELPQPGPAIDRLLLLVSLFAMPELCRTLTTYQTYQKIEILVQSNTRDVGKVKEAWHEKLLDCLREARGCGRVGILDAQGNESNAQLATMMKTPISLQTLYDRVLAYHDRGLKNKRQGRLAQARCELMNGLDYIFWFRAGKYHKQYQDISGNEELAEKLYQTSIKTGFECAFLCIKFGDLEWALHLVRWMLKFQGGGGGNRRNQIEPQAWWIYGLRDLAIGAKNGAIYCFLQTLWQMPGHLGAESAVDELDAQLQSCTGLTERIVLHNIQHVLQPFRHQTPGSAIRSDALFWSLMGEWYSGLKEVNSIGYAHISKNSIRLENNNNAWREESW